MESWLIESFGMDAGFARSLQFVIALLAVLIALACIVWILRRLPLLWLNRGGRNRQPRLAVLDTTPVDSRRRLVLVRRDNVEHLIMIGGPSDVVVEQNIGSSFGRAEQLAQAVQAVPQQNVADSPPAIGPIHGQPRAPAAAPVAPAVDSQTPLAAQPVARPRPRDPGAATHNGARTRQPAAAQTTAATEPPSEPQRIPERFSAPAEPSTAARTEPTAVAEATPRKTPDLQTAKLKTYPELDTLRSRSAGRDVPKRASDAVADKPEAAASRTASNPPADQGMRTPARRLPSADEGQPTRTAETKLADPAPERTMPAAGDEPPAASAEATATAPMSPESDATEPVGRQTEESRPTDRTAAESADQRRPEPAPPKVVKPPAPADDLASQLNQLLADTMGPENKSTADPKPAQSESGTSTKSETSGNGQPVAGAGNPSATSASAAVQSAVSRQTGPLPAEPQAPAEPVAPKEKETVKPPSGLEEEMAKLLDDLTGKPD